MRNWKLSAGVGLLGLIASVAVALNYPAVENLGAKVRLPVFHGALSWATLMAYAALGLCALLYLVRKNQIVYRWAEALQWTATTLWIIGTVLGFLAAMNTWDFTGSKTPMGELLMSDPRLVGQIVVALLGLAMFFVPLLIESQKGRAIANVVYAIAAWVGIGWATTAGKALHPDSPVLNSTDPVIKVLFYCMVLADIVLVVGAAGAIVGFRSKQLAAKSAHPSATQDNPDA